MSNAILTPEQIKAIKKERDMDPSQTNGILTKDLNRMLEICNALLIEGYVIAGYILQPNGTSYRLHLEYVPENDAEMVGEES